MLTIEPDARVCLITKVEKSPVPVIVRADPVLLRGIEVSDRYGGQVHVARRCREVFWRHVHNNDRPLWVGFQPQQIPERTDADARRFCLAEFFHTLVEQTQQPGIESMAAQVQVFGEQSVESGGWQLAELGKRGLELRNRLEIRVCAGVVQLCRRWAAGRPIGRVRARRVWSGRIVL